MKDKYSVDYTILASDMDINYHITPNAILLYFQDCFARYLSSYHIAAFDILNKHLLWVIYEFHLHFIAERPLWAEQIKVELWFSQISTLKMQVNFRLLKSNGEPFAEGTSIWVIINSDTRRPQQPSNLLNGVGITINPENVEETNETLPSEQILFHEVEHAVNVSDLDFNGHVCNRSYLSIAMCTSPVEFLNTHQPRYIHIKFVREAFINDILKCRIYTFPTTPNLFLHRIVNSSNKEICNISSEWDPCTPSHIDDVVKNVKRY